MALTDYERYQLEWMIDHGHSLKELVTEFSAMEEYLAPIPDIALMPGDILNSWINDPERSFGGEKFASGREWRKAKGIPNHEYGITKDMVRKGIEQGVIRFGANPDPRDPWKTVCAIGNGYFYFVDTDGITPEEYVRMNANNLDMVVDDVWEALNSDVLADYTDDYERYASILSEPHEGGTSSLSLPEKQAVGVGYCFNLFDTALLIGANIDIKETGTVVTVDGKDYPLMKGATYEDSRAVDALLDSHGEKRISDYEKQPQGMSILQAAREARESSDALTERKTADDPGGKDERER